MVATEILGDLRRSERLRLIEVRVPRSVPVFATGRVTTRGLVPSRTGLTLLNTGTRADMIEARRESLRTGGTITSILTSTGLAIPAALWLTLTT
ncbi:hypothetical protein [Actinoplanes sp. G11-F43]|uniref:hypothetical protein n=1 Tax=Actinoplanes sp. G11-F43 TaxID=3424130 RepID=UPI003D346662